LNVLLLSAWALAAVHQPPQTPVFRVSVEAVQVDVHVGRGRKAVTGLDVDDFELFDNGVRQRIELVDIETVPLNVALVLDTSQSVAGSKLLHLQSAAHAFLRGLDDKDRAGLITFCHRLHQASGLTSDLDVLHRAIDRVEAYGSTKWHDALFAGLKAVELAKDRPVVLLFTDGEDTYSWLREDQLPALVERSNAVLYVIHGREEIPMLPSDRPSSPRWQRGQSRKRVALSRRTEILRELTEIGGGRFLVAGDEQRLQEAFLEVLAELKTRYLLTYYPSPEVSGEGWHEVKVKLTKQKGDIRARRGYFRNAARPATVP
jgi:VWFA-related protein